MINHRLPVAIAAIAVAILCISSPSCRADKFASGHILVKFKPGTPASEVAAVHRQNGARVLDQIDQIGVQKVSALKGRELAQVKRYAANPNVEFAEPDYLYETMATIPNDPAFKNWQWGLHYIKAPEAWDISVGNESTIIAVIDTGVHYGHEDLQGRIMPGYDFYDLDDDPMDESGHGTHVVGVLGAATNNGIGVAGLTWTNPILPLKVFGATGVAPHSVTAKAITHAADQKARVINLSLGGSQISSTMKAATDYAYERGVVLAAAAGNSGTNDIYYPAAYPNVLAVGATNDNDERTSYSNFGVELDVVAPSWAMSTCPWAGYGTMGGTSVSTPYVTGLCGLILSVDPSLSPSQVMQIIRETADDLPPIGWDEYTGYGRINAHKALLRASRVAESNPIDSTPPTISLVHPVAGSVLSGVTSLSSQVNDDSDVVKVEYHADAIVIASTIKAPFSVYWDTSKTPNGQQWLYAKAYDSAGNCGQSEVIAVTINNPVVTDNTFTGSVSIGGITHHSISLSAQASLIASLDWNKGDLDLELVDAAGAIVASSRSSARPESVEIRSLPAGQYRFSIIGVSGSGKIKYTLSARTTSQ